VKTSIFFDALVLSREVDAVVSLSSSVVLYPDGKLNNETRLATDRTKNGAVPRGILPPDCFKNSGQMYRMFAQSFRRVAIPKPACPMCSSSGPKFWAMTAVFLLKSFNAGEFAEVSRLDVQLVQPNHRKSAKGVLRSLNYQPEFERSLLWSDPAVGGAVVGRRCAAAGKQRPERSAPCRCGGF